ncbi:nucleotidyltransferase [Rheinheimera aquimaris]|uniref:Nucleotidyltransferase n=1 Tax=Rheinheimera aquimaris TaxID=412437 RepID=A0ABN1DRY7_9GAMM|nr:nucleotidyltransferase family protein [Rheinheimera aquimaris]MCB5213575.1 nucleotidyltransferase family protein [Rheinheimera aquimaris]
MRPSDALSHNRALIHTLVARYKATNPRIFGSVAMAKDTEGSDLDLLVDTLPGTTLFDLGELQLMLEEALGVPVDLLTPGDLPEKIRVSILRQAVPV